MLDGILPAPRGLPQIEVTFDIDANGILSVRAVDKGTGKEQKITITASSGLNKDEVEKMRRDAEAHAAEDTKRKEEVEARNTADTLAYTAEKTLRDYKDKIPANLNQEIEEKIKALRSALQGTDITAVRRATDDLNQAMQKVGSSVYGAAASAGRTATTSGRSTAPAASRRQGRRQRHRRGRVQRSIAGRLG